MSRAACLCQMDRACPGDGRVRSGHLRVHIIKSVGKSLRLGSSFCEPVATGGSEFGQRFHAGWFEVAHKLVSERSRIRLIRNRTPNHDQQRRDTHDHCHVHHQGTGHPPRCQHACGRVLCAHAVVIDRIDASGKPNEQGRASLAVRHHPLDRVICNCLMYSRSARLKRGSMFLLAMAVFIAAM